jgi:hypothetical protein
VAFPISPPARPGKTQVSEFTSFKRAIKTVAPKSAVVALSQSFPLSVVSFASIVAPWRLLREKDSMSRGGNKREDVHFGSRNTWPCLRICFVARAGGRK